MRGDRSAQGGQSADTDSFGRRHTLASSPFCISSSQISRTGHSNLVFLIRLIIRISCSEFNAQYLRIFRTVA